MNIFDRAEYSTASPEATMALAAEVAAGLTRGSVLALYGDLGSGKTCFVQGLAAALGIDEPITSPTFTLIDEHQGRERLYHIDLYRLHGEADLASLDLDTYLEPDGITAIEWAERAEAWLPPHTVRVRFQAAAEEDARRIVIDRPVSCGRATP